MKDIYDEKEVEKLSQGVLDSVKDKIKDQIADEVYSKIGGYLYEHYTNNKDKIESELIKSIVEEYVKNPNDYKYADLRKKIFLENKEELTKILTDEAIYKSVEAVIEQYTHQGYHFEWRWKDGIARFILENFSKFKDDERIKEWIGRDMERKDNRIKWLEEKLREVSSILDD
jgi:hypothetical protein